MKNHTTLVVLLLLSVFAAWVSSLTGVAGYLVFTVMGLAMVKLLLVAFQFMEIKNAHLFWKSALLVFAITFCLVISLLVGS